MSCSARHYYTKDRESTAISTASAFRAELRAPLSKKLGVQLGLFDARKSDFIRL